MYVLNIECLFKIVYFVVCKYYSKRKEWKYLILVSNIYVEVVKGICVDVRYVLCKVDI